MQGASMTSTQYLLVGRENWKPKYYEAIKVGPGGGMLANFQNWSFVIGF